MISIIDYGMGNLGSLKNAFNKIGQPAKLVKDIQDIECAEKLVLPGVGSFDTGIHNLKENGIIDTLNYKVKQDKTPILGICLGMQLMTKASEEGANPGLDWIDAKTIKFSKSDDPTIKIPNMGWRQIEIKIKHPFLEGISSSSRFYFVHSYHVKCNDIQNILAISRHGIDFTAIYSNENIYGVQFHPEKSLKYGLNLLENFSQMT